LERVTRQDYVPPSLDNENARAVNALVKGALDRAVARQLRRPIWPKTRALLILILLCIIVGVVEKSCNITLPT
jgi:hypothetical protein